ncbi:hypothetical protein [Paracoccus seriniphilus]|uniref:Inner membrane protein n=1 Tax=Paracoccus seriniphilus TaxID=184748 RepID=A0A239PSE4_9RHOB|nr:hypothetical protein [Paracoccus seriniphilus]WCR14429.1 hypothetical protein JHW44_02935 [Paracoccus seriniphilus]SNT72852.1 hypothetical protein SAMN05444959_10423 [Paracoccus seriniphilus]
MKKPEEIKSASDKKASEAAKPGKIVDKPAEPVRKAAAKPGTLEMRDTGAGDGKAAMAGGGKIEAVESTLVGSGSGGRPAAQPRKPADPAKAGAAEGTADKGTTNSVAPEKSAVADKPVAQPAAAEGSGRDTAISSPAQNVTVKKTGFWPVVLGGVVAAGLGSAATIWALPHLPAGWLPAAPEAGPVATAEFDPAPITAEAVAKAQEVARQEVDALRAELAANPAPEGTATDAVTPDPRIDEILAQLEEQDRRIAQLSAQPGIDPELAQRVQTLADKAAALEGQIAAAAENAQSTIAAAQAEAQKLQEAAAASTRRAEAVAAIASLQAALDRGVTPDEARKTLEDAGLQAPEALNKEVPSLISLQEDFPDAARAALRASLRSDSAEGGNVITNFLRAQIGARSVAPREGDDADAILSRANAKVEAGDIAAALTELTDLSDTARNAPSMADWLSGATAYQDAHSALSDLSATSN